ncbi:hypothetical protein EV199_1514 [Pseudobacter ginsenosidimutans]|uniref:Uncharacterized protein n=1 Tax=Pseudobacter ginsenosidimutans TaxID=661488 RepID=A0A4Q7N3T7_9BACT|nr:hypothetical protein EV199_1514 [Pseudobacter ginsenosidimutans]
MHNNIEFIIAIHPKSGNRIPKKEKEFTTFNNILKVCPEMVNKFPFMISSFTGSGK